jgi:hypothetical protein
MSTGSLVPDLGCPRCVTESAPSTTGDIWGPWGRWEDIKFDRDGNCVQLMDAAKTVLEMYGKLTSDLQSGIDAVQASTSRLRTTQVQFKESHQQLLQLINDECDILGAHIEHALLRGEAAVTRASARLLELTELNVQEVLTPVDMGGRPLTAWSHAAKLVDKMGRFKESNESVTGLREALSHPGVHVTAPPERAPHVALADLNTRRQALHALLGIVGCPLDIAEGDAQAPGPHHGGVPQ